MIKWLKVALAVSGALGFLFSATIASADTDAEIAKRLAPVGEVCVQGQKCDVATAAASSSSSSAPRTGEELYHNFCSACHGTGAAGAPKYGDKQAWAPRIAKGKQTLYSHATNGFNAMPPKGTCMGCSEQEIHNAVDYMVKAAK